MLEWNVFKWEEKSVLGAACTALEIMHVCYSIDDGLQVYIMQVNSLTKSALWQRALS